MTRNFEQDVMGPRDHHIEAWHLRTINLSRTINDANQAWSHLADQSVLQWALDKTAGLILEHWQTGGLFSHPYWTGTWLKAQRFGPASDKSVTFPHIHDIIASPLPGMMGESHATITATTVFSVFPSVNPVNKAFASDYAAIYEENEQPTPLGHRPPYAQTVDDAQRTWLPVLEAFIVGYDFANLRLFNQAHSALYELDLDIL